jgi:hypothetical protein
VICDMLSTRTSPCRAWYTDNADKEGGKQMRNEKSRFIKWVICLACPALHLAPLRCHAAQKQRTLAGWLGACALF